MRLAFAFVILALGGVWVAAVEPPPATGVCYVQVVGLQFPPTVPRTAAHMSITATTIVNSHNFLPAHRTLNGTVHKKDGRTFDFSIGFPDQNTLIDSSSLDIITPLQESGAVIPDDTTEMSFTVKIESAVGPDCKNESKKERIVFNNGNPLDFAPGDLKPFPIDVVGEADHGIVFDCLPGIIVSHVPPDSRTEGLVRIEAAVLNDPFCLPGLMRPAVTFADRTGQAIGAVFGASDEVVNPSIDLTLNALSSPPAIFSVGGILNRKVVVSVMAVCAATSGETAIDGVGWLPAQK